MNGVQFLLIVLGLAVLIVTFLAFLASRFVRVGPNQALIISGRSYSAFDPASQQWTHRGFRIVKGGGAVIIPVLERADVLSLELIALDVLVPKAHTAEGVPLTVEGVAQVKVKGDDASIAAAAEHFLSKSASEVGSVALQTLEGHLRTVVGTLKREQLTSDHAAFARKLQESSAADLARMGLELVSFTVKAIHD